MITDICVDLETLGIRPDAVILSMGVAFLDDTSETVETLLPDLVFPIEGQLDVGRSINWSTLTWWMDQSDEARKIAFSSKRESFLKVENSINDIDRVTDNGTRVWSKDPNFDCVILRSFVEAMGWKEPEFLQRFYRWRSIRTVEELARQRGQYIWVDPETPHSAASDALAEMKSVVAARELIGGRDD